MAIAMLVDTPGMTSDDFEAIDAELTMPAECSVRVAGPTPDGTGWRVISVWDSPEDARAFASETLQPLFEQRGIQWGGGSPPQMWTVHRLDS